MSRLTQLIQTQGQHIKVHALFRKTSTAYSWRTISEHILNYIDETTKPRKTETGKKVMGYDTYARDPGEPLKESVNYLTKEPAGTVRVFGFLRDEIIRTYGKPPTQMTNNQRVEAAHAIWQQLIAKKPLKTFGHKIVISFDPRLCEILKEVNMSVDEHLQEIAKSTMRRFQEKYYPNEKLGYILGIHHDKTHIHAHILLYPTTEQGKLLSLSDGLVVTGKTEREHRLTFLRETTRKLGKDFYDKHVLQPATASQRPLESVMQRKLLTMAALEQYNKEGLRFSEDEKWDWIVKRRNQMETMGDVELRHIIAQTYEAELSRFESGKKKLDTYPKQAKVRDSLEQETKSIQDEISKLKVAQDAAKADWKAIMDMKKKSFQDMGQWRSISRLKGRLPVGKFAFANSENANWVLQRVSENDDFARYLRSEPAMDYISRLQVIPPDWASPMRASAAQRSGTMFTKLLQLRQKYAKGNLTIPRFEEDLIRSYLHTENELLRDTQKKVAAIKMEMQQRIEMLRAQMQILTLNKVMLRGVAKTKLPDYLAQYSDWKKNNIAIPVTGRRLGKEQYRKSLEERQARKKLEHGEESAPQKKVDALTDDQVLTADMGQVVGSFAWPSKIRDGAKTLGQATPVDKISTDKPVDNALTVYFGTKRDTLTRNTPSNQTDPESNKKKLRDNLGDVSGLT